MIYKDYVKYEKALSSNNHKGKAYKNQVLQKNYSRSLFSAFFRNEEEKPYEERKKTIDSYDFLYDSIETYDLNKYSKDIIMLEGRHYTSDLLFLDKIRENAKN